MKKLKILSFCLAIVMIMGSTGCNNVKKGVTSSGNKITSSVNSTGDKTSSNVNSTVDKVSSVANSVGNANSLKANVSIAKGTKAMDDGLNFKGKEFKLAIPYDSGPGTQRKIDAFNVKFNCKLKMTIINWDEYNTALATTMTSGAPYDVVFFHSNFYPSLIVSNVVQPLQSVITTADYMDTSKPAAGGLSNELTKFFVWNNSIYAASSNRSVFPILLYYNKNLFRDGGMEDPLALYKKGQWTWDKIKSMGVDVTDPSQDTFFLGGMGDVTEWMQINAISGITFDGSQPKQSLNSSKLVSTMNSYKDLFIGGNAISAVEAGSDFDRFKSGKAYMICAVSDYYSTAAETAKTSNAFGKSADNLGVVPIPFTSLNTDKAYPVHAPQGWASGKGSADVRVAVAFAKFESTWVDSVKAQNVFSTDVQNEVNKIYQGKMYTSLYGFTDTDGKTYPTIMNRNIGDKIRQGGDIASLLTQNQQPIQKCIVDSMAKQN
jgi:ABC-type glycerol-3-phosphate transport system substrate-binding protein